MSSRVGSLSGTGYVSVYSVSPLCPLLGEAATYRAIVVVYLAFNMVGILVGWRSSTILLFDVTLCLSCSCTSLSPGRPDVVLWATGSV